MPYRTEYVPAPLLLEHNGVKIYHCFKNNDECNPVLEYWYDVEEDSDEDGETAFDVRDLSAWNGNVEESIRVAIDKGEITQEGVKEVDNG